MDYTSMDAGANPAHEKSKRRSFWTGLLIGAAVAAALAVVFTLVAVDQNDKNGKDSGGHHAVGRCCLPDGACQAVKADECNGHFDQATVGAGSALVCPAENPCPKPESTFGRCCSPNGECRALTRASCISSGGNLFDDATVGAPAAQLCPADPGANLCPQPESKVGRCCAPDGGCHAMTRETCLLGGDGAVFDNATTGAPSTLLCPANANPCTQPVGRCCMPDGSCRVTERAQCVSAAAAGVFDAGTVGGHRDDMCPAVNPCPQPAAPTPDACQSADQRPLPVGLQYQMKSMMDTSVSPCDDFYRYACGGWIDRTQLGDQDEIVYSFTNIGEVVQREILEARAESYPMVDKLIASCSDVAAMSAGVLRPLFAQIDAAPLATAADFLTVSGRLQANGLAFGALFSWTVMQSLVDAQHNEMFIEQGGLSFDGTDYASWGFPESDYVGVLPAWQALGLAGLLPPNTNATEAMNEVMEIEKRLMTCTVVHTSRLNDPANWADYVQSQSLPDFAAATNLNLEPFFSALSPSHAITKVLSVEPDKWQCIADNLFAGPDSALHAGNAALYLKWRLTYGALRFLPGGFQDAADSLASWAHSDGPYEWPEWPLEVTEPEQFRGHAARLPRILKRPSTRHPRGRGRSPEERREVGRRFAAFMADSDRADFCYPLADGFFGTHAMHSYLLQNFPQFDAELANRLVNATVTAMHKRLETVVWLDEPTRKAALSKLEHLVPNVATDPFEGVADLSVDWTASPFEVFRQLVVWRFNHTMHQAGTDFDRHGYQGSPYEMAPWVQNAYYQPTSNTINLLPGLMLPPMFGPDLPYSINVASYLMVVGHEITHGFDNSGRSFGPYGNYINWWTDEAVAEFDKRTQCLVDQYSEFEEYGIHVNGSQTLGENIADGGGVDMAWAVYKSIDPPPREGMFDGHTNDQLHFLWYAQTWCTKMTQEAYEGQVGYDVHSPDQFRIRGPLSNFKPFAQAYNCTAEQYYGRSLTTKACEVW